MKKEKRAKTYTNKKECDKNGIEDIIEIDEYLYLDDEDADHFISKDMNEKKLKKFLQIEKDFYIKAFPQDTLLRKTPK